MVLAPCLWLACPSASTSKLLLLPASPLPQALSVQELLDQIPAVTAEERERYLRTLCDGTGVAWSVVGLANNPAGNKEVLVLAPYSMQPGHATLLVDLAVSAMALFERGRKAVGEE